MFQIESPDFKEGGNIPRKFTCEGEDVSPLLRWTPPPQGAKSYMLIMEDPDAPMGTFVHWLAYDIPAGRHELPYDAAADRGLKGVMKQGLNDFGNVGYGGPCPPRGHGVHRYFFIFKALDTTTMGLPEGASRSEIERAATGHILAEARLMGRFER